MRRTFAVVLLLILPLAAAAAVPAPRDGDGGGRAEAAAHLFGYYPKAGMGAQFDRGYREHLEWHRRNRDPLPWYGWYVVEGERFGMFIDGTFGAPFAAFDARVAPAEDGRNAREVFLPYATPAFRASYRLRPELGDATPLEERRPPPMLAVYTYRVRPGMAAAFEALVRALRTAGADPGGSTWYEAVAGTRVPEYVLMSGRADWAAFAAGGGLEARIARLAPAQDRERLAAQLAQAVERVDSEVWAYREDLSLIPE